MGRILAYESKGRPAEDEEIDIYIFLVVFIVFSLHNIV
jgi:hypothetical protein